MMKQFVLLMALALVIGGCSNQSQESKQETAEAVETQVSDVEAVKQRVEEIYGEVFKEYNREDTPQPGSAGRPWRLCPSW